MPTGYEAVIHASLSFVELLILVSWLTFRNGIRLPLVTTIGALSRVLSIYLLLGTEIQEANHHISGINTLMSGD